MACVALVLFFYLLGAQAPAPQALATGPGSNLQSQAATAQSEPPAATASGPVTPAQPLSPPDQEQADFLWPHLRDGAPSRELLAQVHAQWMQFAQQHPDNIFLPPQYQAPMAPAQIRAARERMDASLAVETDMVILQSAVQHTLPGQLPVAPQVNAMPSADDIAQRRHYFDTKVQQLESLVQLADHWLSTEPPGPEERITAEKEVQQWKSEIQTLREVRAKLPAP